MKRALFIDRDGTIIKEPSDFQVDSPDKLRFVGKAITELARIAASGRYTLVMVTNQDGLGTDAFPESAFAPLQDLMIETLAGEGVIFEDVFIDRTFESDNSPTRKPGVGMLGKYCDGSFDLTNSFVIGDRATDVELAKNLGSKAIFIETPNFELSDTDDTVFKVKTWGEISLIVLGTARRAAHRRKTNETNISVAIDLDGGETAISTGIRFFDHMLEQVARHSGIGLRIDASGDLDVDEHHTIEDVAIAFGEAFDMALGDKRGIGRYGFCLPMDDCLAQVAIDLGGRNWVEWDAKFNREKIGEMPTEMFFHFFKSFSDAARCNLNIKAEGTIEHHKIESIFKAFARCLRQAIKIEGADLPSTKGKL